MAKWADYLISGVWFSEDENTRHVSYLELHKDSESTIGNGKNVSKDHIISLLENGNTVKTIRWNYSDKTWSKGASGRDISSK